MSDEAELKKARFYALKVFNLRPRSTEELREKLLGRGFAQDVISAVVDEFSKKGLLNDSKFSKLWVESRMASNPKGAFLLKRELKEKGVKDEIIDRVIKESAGGHSEYEVVKTLAESRMAALKDLDATAVKRRLFGYLRRRGFTVETIMRVMDEIGVK